MSVQTKTAIGTAAMLPMTGVGGTALAALSAAGIGLVVIGVLIHRATRK
jgi:hypothetical protein